LISTPVSTYIISPIVKLVKLLHLGIDIAYGSTCGVADAGNPMKIELPF